MFIKLHENVGSSVFTAYSQVSETFFSRSVSDKGIRKCDRIKGLSFPRYPQSMSISRRYETPIPLMFPGNVL
jgi:hypothetical protein